MFLLTASSAFGIEYPLSVSPDGRNLLDATGTAQFLNGASPWHIVARLDQAEVIAYLDQRQAQGFNTLLMSLVVPGAFTGSVLNAYGDRPFTTTNDFSTPNEPYFAHADWIIQQAHQRDMLILLCHTYVGWGCGPEGWCAQMQAQGVTAMREWGRWLGQRYLDQPNIIWVNGGDVDASAFGASALVDAIAEGILEVDSAHLHTAHCSRFLSGADCYDRPWLDVDATYANCSIASSKVQSSYENLPVRPTFYIEGIYESAPDASPECTRREAWIPTLGGSIGSVYGSEDVWDFPSGWSNALVTESTASLTVLMNLVSARRWSEFIPDYPHSVVVAGYGGVGTVGYVAAARAADGSSILAYLPTQTTVSVDLSFVSGTSAEIWWIHPATGDANFAGVYPTSGIQVLNSPVAGDCVLVIDDLSAPLFNPWDTATDASGPGATLLFVAEPYPNPFNPRVSIDFSAAEGVLLRADVFNARGARVARIHEGRATGHMESIVWDARAQSSGVYYVRFQAGRELQTRRLVLVR